MRLKITLGGITLVNIGKDEQPREAAVRSNRLLDISERLKTQDNRCTANPMFCVQIKRRDVGYDANYATGQCWHDSANDETIYDDDPNFKEPEGDEWENFGYVDRWETVMVAFTEKGCEEYLALNGHNDRRRAHNGEVRIYAESFNRCPEMIAIREALMSNDELTHAGPTRTELAADPNRRCVQ